VKPLQQVLLLLPRKVGAAKARKQCLKGAIGDELGTSIMIKKG